MHMCLLLCTQSVGAKMSCMVRFTFFLIMCKLCMSDAAAKEDTWDQSHFSCCQVDVEVGGAKAHGNSSHLLASPNVEHGERDHYGLHRHVLLGKCGFCQVHWIFSSECVQHLGYAHSCVCVCVFVCLCMCVCLCVCDFVYVCVCVCVSDPVGCPSSLHSGHRGQWTGFLQFCFICCSHKKCSRILL